MTQPKEERAFPSGQSPGGMPFHEGMTLLDWFAGQALAGMLANGQPESLGLVHATAVTAYILADAMMKERETRTVLERTDNTADRLS